MNRKLEKKCYIAPAIKVVELRRQENLLQCSNGTGNCNLEELGLSNGSKDFLG